MKRIGLTLALALVVGLGLLPGAAWAWSNRNSVGVPAGHVSVFVGHPFVHHHFFHPGFVHHRFFAPSVIVTNSVVVVEPVWVPGFWSWTGFQWVWVPGRWGW